MLPGLTWPLHQRFSWRRVGSTTTPVTLAPQPLNQIGMGSDCLAYGRRRGDNEREIWPLPQS